MFSLYDLMTSSIVWEEDRIGRDEISRIVLMVFDFASLDYIDSSPSNEIRNLVQGN
jgi:hypothetical protein